jgi:F-type H+-transporting ATPase subunit b
MDQAAESVKNAIMNGIDLIREGAGVDITSATFIIQICATLFLFLIVRFKCWNIVTSLLVKRKEAVQVAIDNKNQLELESKALQEQSSHLIEDAKNEATTLVQDAKKLANVEKDKIINDAKQEAERLLNNANQQVEQMKQDVQEDIKNEIIEVAYLLSEKITKSHIDRTKDQELVQEFLKEELAND